MDVVMKAVNATIEDTSASPTEFPGTFEVELSNESLDRDGDELKADEWETPLPQQITFVNDHTHKMASVVGSATPELVDGKILCRGTWAETDNAQDTRKVIKHVPYVSVAYREKRGQKGSVSRELINGSFVVVPSNTKARVLTSKSMDEMEALLAEPLTKALIADSVAEAMRQIGSTLGVNTYNVTLGDPNVHGITFEVDEKSSTITVKQHDTVLGTHEFSQDTAKAPPKGADPHADPAEDEAAALAKAKAAAFQITSETGQYTEQEHDHA